jgi:hypothetical protein
VRAFLTDRRWLIMLAGTADTWFLLDYAYCFLIIAAVPGMTTTVAPFLLVYGVSSFFTEFGPNMTTFVMPSELYSVAIRATGQRHAGVRARYAQHEQARAPIVCVT